MKSYPWSWVGKARDRLFGAKFRVVRLTEAEAALWTVAAKTQRAEPVSKLTVPSSVEKRLLNEIKILGGRYIVGFTKLEDGSVITTAALKLEDGYYMGRARESRAHEMSEQRAKIVALGRALKAATKGWDNAEGDHTNELLDERLCLTAGPVDIIELPDYLLQNEDRKRR